MLNKWSLLSTILLSVGNASATDTQLDWFNDDAEFKAAEVNEGSLVFLADVPEDAFHHHHNTLVLSASSLKDGWASLEQCHYNIDPVPLAEIVYGQDRIRDLTIDYYNNIGSAWLEDNSVQLKDVAPHASVCVHARSKALVHNADGSYSLRNGPFMRRFLDGYYPMRVSYDVVLPRDGLLKFVSIKPVAQKGFEVTQTAEGVSVNTLFEGKLNTEIRFSKTP